MLHAEAREPPTTLKIILLRYIAIVTGQNIELQDVQSVQDTFSCLEISCIPPGGARRL